MQSMISALDNDIVSALEMFHEELVNGDVQYVSPGNNSSHNSKH